MSHSVKKTSLKWLTVAIPLLEMSERLEIDKGEPIERLTTKERLARDKRWRYGLPYTIKIAREGEKEGARER